MPRIFDCVVFSDELDALEARFRALEHIPEVTHVIAEAPVDHHGQPKPARFQEDRERREDSRFAPWHGRWTHVLVGAHELPQGTPEAREAALRDYLAHGITGGPEDIILHGKITEIPDPGTVRSLAAGTFAPPVTVGSVIARHWRDVERFADLNIYLP